VYNGHEATVRQLLSKEGIDVKARVSFNQISNADALSLAKQRSNEAIIRLLKEYSSRNSTPSMPSTPEAVSRTTTRPPVGTLLNPINVSPVVLAPSELAHANNPKSVDSDDNFGRPDGEDDSENSGW